MAPLPVLPSDPYPHSPHSLPNRQFELDGVKVGVGEVTTSKTQLRWKLDNLSPGGQPGGGQTPRHVPLVLGALPPWTACVQHVWLQTQLGSSSRMRLLRTAPSCNDGWIHSCCRRSRADHHQALGSALWCRLAAGHHPAQGRPLPAAAALARHAQRAAHAVPGRQLHVRRGGGRRREGERG